MAKNERSKKSTVSNTLETFKKANQLPEPKRELTERQLSHFKDVMKSREVSTWSDYDLITATNLALTLDAMDEQWDDLKINGWKVYSERGTPVKNPASDQLNQLAASARSYSATLGLSASQRGLAGSKQDSRNKAELSAREIIKKAAEDDLLA